MKLHNPHGKRETTDGSKNCTVRVAVHRANELMVILLNDGHEDAEKININERILELYESSPPIDSRA